MPNENFVGRDGEPIACKEPARPYGSNCLVCQQRVIIHCEECGTQVSGCNCTIKERVVDEMRN